MKLSAMRRRRRILDTASGFALGVALCVLVLAWHAVSAAPAPPAQPSPWPGCTIGSFSQSSGVIRMEWDCVTPTPASLR